MRQWLLPWVCVGVLAGAGPASAGPFSALEYRFFIPGLTSASFSASGLAGIGSAFGTGTTASWTVHSGVLPSLTVRQVLQTDPSFATEFWANVRLSGNQMGSFQATGGGVMTLSGVAQVTVPPILTFPLVSGSIAAGVPTTRTVPQMYGIQLMAYGNAWTTKSTVLLLTTSTQFGATTRRVTGTNNLVNGLGQVTLVSALNVVEAFDQFPQVPAFLSLTLHVPEPGSAVVLVAAAAALALGGLRSRRR